MSGTSKTVVVHVTTQPGHRRPNNSTTTTAWRISFLLICTRLHEFELVPYIIINLPHKLGAHSFICLNNACQMMPPSPGVHPGVFSWWLTGRAPLHHREVSAVPCPTSAQAPWSHRLISLMTCPAIGSAWARSPQAGACATYTAWWGSMNCNDWSVSVLFSPPLALHLQDRHLGMAFTWP